MIIKKASLITPTYFWLLYQIKMFCVFFNARVIGLYCHNWFFLPTSIIFHPILTRTTPILGYKWHFFHKNGPQKGQMVKCFFRQIQVPFLFPSRLRSKTQLVVVHTTMYTKHKERTTLWSYQLLSSSFRRSCTYVTVAVLVNFCPKNMENIVAEIYIFFAIIQSTFYRIIKGQQYLKKMYEINCDD